MSGPNFGMLLEDMQRDQLARAAEGRAVQKPGSQKAKMPSHKQESARKPTFTGSGPSGTAAKAPPMAGSAAQANPTEMIRIDSSDDDSRSIKAGPSKKVRRDGPSKQARRDDDSRSIKAGPSKKVRRDGPSKQARRDEEEDVLSDEDVLSEEDVLSGEDDEARGPSKPVKPKDPSKPRKARDPPVKVMRLHWLQVMEQRLQIEAAEADQAEALLPSVLCGEAQACAQQYRTVPGFPDRAPIEIKVFIEELVAQTVLGKHYRNSLKSFCQDLMKEEVKRLTKKPKN